MLSPHGGQCLFDITPSGDRLLSSVGGYTVKCDWTNNSSCQLVIDSPVVNDWHFTDIDIYNKSMSLQMTVIIEVQGM